MGYSSYGGLCWRFKDGEKPERYKPVEDGSLHSEGPSDDRPLEQATGMKFDALLKANPDFGKGEPELSEQVDEATRVNTWLAIEAHHIAIGGMTGAGLINHKGRAWIMLNGEAIKECDWDDSDDGPSYHGAFAVPKFDSPTQCHWAVQMLTDPYVSLNWIRYPDSMNYLAVGGYGVGEHWFLDEDNRAMKRAGDDWESDPDGVQYPTESEWLDKLVAWHKQILSEEVA